MMKDQPTETTMRVLAEINPHSASLSKSQDRPDFFVTQGTNRAGVSQAATTLPVELAAIVYSHCDAESAVALRLTCLYWYLAFQVSDYFLKPIVLARNPFIRPEGQLKTWGDCLLVFVSRLPCRSNKKRNIQKKDKWIAVPSFSKILRLSDEDITPPTKRVIALELKPGEKIADTFELIDNHNGDLLLDPKTKECVRLVYDVLVDNDEEKVIEFYGLKITLRAHFDISHFVVYRHHLEVHGRGSSALRYSFKDPLHFKNALHVYPMWKEVGRFTFWCNESLGRTTWLYHHNGELTNRYGPTESYGLSPFAAYQGIVWMTETPRLEHGHLQHIPTFVDLDRPKTIYYRKDWIMSITEEYYLSLMQCHNGRFVIIQDTEKLDLLDLETRSIVKVRKPHRKKSSNTSDSDCGAYIPGFVGDKFQALYMDPDTVEKYDEDF